MSTIKNQLSMRITFWLLFVSRQKVTKERISKAIPILNNFLYNSQQRATINPQRSYPPFRQLSSVNYLLFLRTPSASACNPLFSLSNLLRLLAREAK
jgi:hypothetical protein